MLRDRLLKPSRSTMPPVEDGFELAGQRLRPGEPLAGWLAAHAVSELTGLDDRSVGLRHGRVDRRCAGQRRRCTACWTDVLDLSLADE